MQRDLIWLDQQVFALGPIVRGHTVKHVAAATAAYCILHMLKHRSRLVGKDAAKRPPQKAMLHDLKASDVT